MNIVKERSIMKLEENIARMEQELEKMKVKLKQEEKLVLEGGEGYCLQALYQSNDKRKFTDNGSAAKRGAFRATKELAELADKNMVTRNRLEAYVHQIQGDGEGEFVLFISNDGLYDRADRSDYRPHLGTVYMQEKTADIICKALNAEEIEL